MNMEVDGNPTRQKIIMLLKKSEHMTVANLSGKMGITPMAVRQHLMTLERKGIIDYTAQKYGIGRPVYLYKLTEKARDIFPKSYGLLINEILRTIEDTDGRKKIDKIFRIRKDLHLSEMGKDMEGIGSMHDKVKALSKMLDKQGFMCELEETDAGFRLKQFNCLLHGVASEFPEACKYELELYSELLGQDIIRTQWQREGAPSCIYEIPRKNGNGTR